MAAINFKTVSRIKLPLPPLEQQKKIAAILDAADTYRQKTKALITKYDELTQSLFLDMFGDPVMNPKGWDEVLMSKACTKVTDGTHDTPERLTEGIKFITGKHIRPYSVNYDYSDYVTQEVHNEIYRRCNPELGDVLYTNIGVNLGTAALNIVDYEFSMKNVALLKPEKDLITGRYMEYFLNSDNMKTKIVWIGSQGGAQQFLSLTLLRRLKINLPPVDLQNQFAERVKAIEVQKAQAQASLAQAEDLFNSLLQKAFKGELVS
jgi:type I restriction enzyme S subunit